MRITETTQSWTPTASRLAQTYSFPFKYMLWLVLIALCCPLWLLAIKIKCPESGTYVCIGPTLLLTYVLTLNHTTLLVSVCYNIRNLLHIAASLVLFAADKGLWGQNVLQSVVSASATYLLKISSPEAIPCRPVLSYGTAGRARHLGFSVPTGICGQSPSLPSTHTHTHTHTCTCIYHCQKLAMWPP